VPGGHSSPGLIDVVVCVTLKQILKL
jgi:hypothetical protein